MKKTLFALALLASSAASADVYIEGGATALANRHVDEYTLYNRRLEQYKGPSCCDKFGFSGLVYYYYPETVRSQQVTNPYAFAAIGYDYDFSKVKIDAKAFYTEAVRIGDRGDFGLSLSVRWYIFR